MRIKQVMDLTGLSEKTIRFYITKGLIAPSSEERMGRKNLEFSLDDINALRDVARFRKLGLSIEEIKLIQQDESKITEILKKHRSRLHSDQKQTKQTLELLQSLTAEDEYNVRSLSEAIRMMDEKSIIEEKNEQRFWYAIRRDFSIHRGQNLLCFFFLTVIATAFFLAFSIHNAAQWAMNELPVETSPILIAQPSFYTGTDFIDALGSNRQNREAVWSRIAMDERVLAVNRLTAHYVKAVDIETYGLSKEEVHQYSYVNANLYLFGNSYPDMVEFHNGDYRLISGRFYTQEEIDTRQRVAVITDELAAYSGLKLHDSFTIRLYPVLGDQDARYGVYEEDLLLTYEVIGIYQNKEKKPYRADVILDGWQARYDYPENYVLVPASSFADVMAWYNEKTIVEPASRHPETYVSFADIEAMAEESYYQNAQGVLQLKDASMVEHFKQEYQAEMLYDYALCSYTSDSSAFYPPFLSIQNQSATHATILIGVLSLFLIVIVVLCVNMRQNECKLAIEAGVSYRQLALRFLVEMGCVAGVALLFGFLAAGAMNQEAAMIYLRNQNGVTVYQKEAYAQWNDLILWQKKKPGVVSNASQKLLIQAEYTLPEPISDHAIERRYFPYPDETIKETWSALAIRHYKAVISWSELAQVTACYLLLSLFVSLVPLCVLRAQTHSVTLRKEAE